mgnify:CR=1 FL=1
MMRLNTSQKFIKKLKDIKLSLLLKNSKILLLDEHTSALDPKMQSLLMEYTCKQVAKQGLTTIMITHRMDDAIKYGNRLIMLHQGKIVLDIEGAEKRTMTVKNLLDMFHQYEDQLLISGGTNDN